MNFADHPSTSTEGHHFLLVSAPHDSYWQGVLAEALSPIGSLLVVTELEAVGAAVERDYGAIIVDAGMVENFALLTAHICAQRPDARVIIVSTSLTWKRARDAFQAGAADYLFKGMNKAELFTGIKQRLKKTATLRPNRTSKAV